MSITKGWTAWTTFLQGPKMKVKLCNIFFNFLCFWKLRFGNMSLQLDQYGVESFCRTCCERNHTKQVSGFILKKNALAICAESLKLVGGFSEVRTVFAGFSHERSGRSESYSGCKRELQQYW